MSAILGFTDEGLARKLGAAGFSDSLVLPAGWRLVAPMAPNSQLESRR